MDITKELLLDNGFTLDEKMNKGSLNFEIYQKYLKDMGKITLRKDDDYDCTNMANRQWFCHVDNDEFMTIGSADVQTTEHMKLVCQLFEFDFSQVFNNLPPNI